MIADQVLDHVGKAMNAAAATFHGRGSVVRERELEMALEAALRARGLEPRRQFPLDLKDAWSGRVGGVDLALAVNDGSPILLELKWDRTSLAACAWDSMKLAAALRAGEGQRAFLVAGSPDAAGELRGDELLEDGELDPAGLRRRYANEFDFWKRDVKNHPLRIPARWRIRARGSASLDYGGSPWRLRLAELELTSTELASVG